MKINNGPIHKLAPEMYSSWPESQADGAPVTVIHCPKAEFDEDEWDDDDESSGKFIGCKNIVFIDDGTQLEKAVAAWETKIVEDEA